MKYEVILIVCHCILSSFVLCAILKTGKTVATIPVEYFQIKVGKQKERTEGKCLAATTTSTGLP